jgi:ATP-binding cassette subfamily B protein
VIAIAHRFTTIRSFDRVVVLENGQVVQDGQPDTLMRREGPYRDLVKQQMIVQNQAA